MCSVLDAKLIWQTKKKKHDFLQKNWNLKSPTF